MYKFKNLNIQDVVKNREWQETRKRLLNKWKTSPSVNISILRNYLRSGKGSKQLRALRIYNYLTGSAFRIGIIQHKEIDKLKQEVKNII